MYVHYAHTVCASLTLVGPTYSPHAAFFSSAGPSPLSPPSSPPLSPPLHDLYVFGTLRGAHDGFQSAVQ